MATEAGASKSVGSNDLRFSRRRFLVQSGLRVAVMGRMVAGQLLNSSPTARQAAQEFAETPMGEKVRDLGVQIQNTADSIGESQPVQIAADVYKSVANDAENVKDQLEQSPIGAAIISKVDKASAEVGDEIDRVRRAIEEEMLKAINGNNVGGEIPQGPRQDSLDADKK